MKEGESCSRRKVCAGILQTLVCVHVFGSRERERWNFPSYAALKWLFDFANSLRMLKTLPLDNSHERAEVMMCEHWTCKSASICIFLPPLSSGGGVWNFFEFPNPIHSLARWLVKNFCLCPPRARLFNPRRPWKPNSNWSSFILPLLVLRVRWSNMWEKTLKNTPSQAPHIYTPLFYSVNKKNNWR